MKLDFDTADRTAIPAAYKWRMEDIFPDKAAYERALGDVETKLGEVAACAGRLAERTLSKAMKKIGFIAK